MKRTYNLDAATINVVRAEVDLHHSARSQDAFVERAIQRFADELRAEREALLYAQAATDPEWREEAEAIERDFAAVDAPWPE